MPLRCPRLRMQQILMGLVLAGFGSVLVLFNLGPSDLPGIPAAHPGSDREDMQDVEITKRILRVLDTKDYFRTKCSIPQDAVNATLSQFQVVNQTLAASSKKLLLAANFRNNDQVIPNIMEQTLKLVDLLGPSKVEVSIMENDSTDKSRPLLQLFEQILQERNVTTHFDLSEEKSDYSHMNRIQLLAGVRNRALTPVLRNASRFDHIIFTNDGLLYQHLTQSADISCGLDYWKRRLVYYDTWVGRTLSGNVIMEHVFNSMFPSDPKDRQRFLKNLPLQVFSCWNGMAILKSKPFGEGVKFRSANETLGECAASECQILARDFWAKGFGRVLMVPWIGFVYDYNLHSSARARKWKRFSTFKDLIEGKQTFELAWRYPGPERVVCFPMEGVNNRDANFWRPIWERMIYPGLPKTEGMYNKDFRNDL